MKLSIRPMDAAWFYVEKPGAPAHFGPLFILSKPKNHSRNYVKDLVEHWQQQTNFRPPFNFLLNRKLVPHWEVLPKERMDLDYHVRYRVLPKPGGERELGCLIAELHSQPLSRKKPLWECYVIEGLEDNRFAIFLKLHHGQFDGMGTVKLVQQSFSADPNRQGLLPFWCQQNGDNINKHQTEKPKLDVAKLLSKTAKELALFPSASYKAAKYFAKSYSGLAPKVTVPFQAPNSILNRRIDIERRYTTQCFSLDRFKLIAEFAQVKINDIFLAIIGGGLRRYLSEIKKLPKQSLIGQIPVNIRNDQNPGHGNRISFIYSQLGTDIENCVARLRVIGDRVRASKESHDAIPPEQLDLFTMMILTPYISQVVSGLSGVVAPAANLVVSNVTGPKQRLYYNGARIEQIYGPSVLFHGQALNITMSSYADELTIGVTACDTVLPSIQKLAVYIGEELRELEIELGAFEAQPLC